MQKIIISAVSIMIAGMVVIYFIHATHNRFTLVIGADGQMYELDRRNGNSWRIDENRKILLDSPDTPRPRMQEQEMARSELKNFSVEGRLNNGTLLGKVYNGSGTAVTRIVLTVTAKELNGKVRWTRNFSEGIFIKPMTTGRFAIGVTNSDGIGDVVFTLAKAYTRPMIENPPAGR